MCRCKLYFQLFAVVTLLSGASSAMEGALLFIEAEFDGVGGTTGLDGARIGSVSPDGQNLYVGSGRANAVAVFSIDAENGALTFMQALIDGENGVEGLGGGGLVAISPDGRHAYAISRAVVQFNRDPDTGLLTFVEAQFDGTNGIQRMSDGIWITVSPDGNYVYVLSSQNDSLLLFARDGQSGALTFIEVLVNGQGGVSGMRGAITAAVSADGANIYVIGVADGSIAVFSRDPATGRLAFVEAKIEGVAGVTGLARVRDVAVAPDGAHLFAASGFTDTGGNLVDTIVTFFRDPMTGELTFADSVSQGQIESEGVVVSPDNQHLYVVGGGTISAYRHDGNGMLSLIDREIEGENGVEGLGVAGQIAISPNGAFVYSFAFSDDAVAVFGRFGPNVITTSIAPTIIEEGELLTLSGPIGTTHQWFKNGVMVVDDPPRLVGSDTRSLAFSPVALSDSETYTLEYDDASKALSTTAAFELIVLPSGTLPVKPLAGIVCVAAFLMALGIAALRDQAS